MLSIRQLLVSLVVCVAGGAFIGGFASYDNGGHFTLGALVGGRHREGSHR